MRSIAAVLALVVGLAASPSPAHRSTVAFELAERDLFPESIAFDPADGAYYVGSMVKRKVVRVAADGTVTDFVPSKQDGLWVVLGMKVDPQRRELWLATCNLGANERPPMIDPEPESAGRTAVYRYDLRTAALVRRYEPQSPPAQLCFNDLVIAPDGSVLLSSGPDGIWHIAEGGSAVELLMPADGMFGNGIAVSDDGATIWLAVHDRGIVAIERATMNARVLPVPEGPHLMGIDGLYLHDGTLVGVQNGTQVARVVRATLSSDGTAVEGVEILEEDHPRFAVPTTGVLVDDALVYVATSQLDHIDPGTNTIWSLERLIPNVFLRLELGAAAAAEVPASVPQTTSTGGCAGRSR